MTVTKTHISFGAAAVVAAVGGLGAVSAAAPPSTEPPTPPVAVEELTRLDAETLVRGAVTDDVTATFNITHEGMDPVTIDIDDLSHVAVARITLQPGGQLPWHTHPGPAIVTVTHGELIYVMADTCEERSYPAGTAFVDPGHGMMIHSAYNPTDSETVIVATFLEMTVDGPLSLTEGIEAPDDNCGIPAADTVSTSDTADAGAVETTDADDASGGEEDTGTPAVETTAAAVETTAPAAEATEPVVETTAPA